MAFESKNFTFAKIHVADTLQPFHSNEIPDEMAGLEFANQAARTITGENKYDDHDDNFVKMRMRRMMNDDSICDS